MPPSQLPPDFLWGFATAACVSESADFAHVAKIVPADIKSKAQSMRTVEPTQYGILSAVGQAKLQMAAPAK